MHHTLPLNQKIHMGSQKPSLNDADDKTAKLHRRDRRSRSSAGMVYTSKGLRARRLRLSAPTAIQFYDVQDRLGRDRSSEVIDWLIEKAKATIDALSGSSEAEGQRKKQSPTRILGLDFPAQSLSFPSMATSVPSSSSTQFQSFPLKNLSQKANFCALDSMIFNATPAELPNQEPPSRSSSNVRTGFPSFPMWE